VNDMQLNGGDISDRIVPEHDCVCRQVSSIQFPDVCGNEFPNILTEKSCSDWTFRVDIIV